MFLDFMLSSFKNNQKKTAMIYKENEYSYEWILNSFYKWQERLDAEDIPYNSVVALESDFNPFSIGVLLALIQRGCILVPLSFSIKNPNELLEIAEAEIFISLKEGEEKIDHTGKTASHKLLMQIKNLMNPGLILFSSGTTGKPKAAVHNLVPLLMKYKIPGKTFRTITFLLFDHIGGFNTLMHILSNSGTIVALESRKSSEVCRLIEKYKVELLPTSPTFLNMILFNREYERYDISCLKMITYGTEPMPASTLSRFNDLYPNIKMKQTYGLSEIGIMSSKSESSDSLWLKVGGEDYETKIVNNILYIRAKTAMLGYLNAPSPFNADGWFNTNDLVEQKGDYIRFLGRESEVINVGGEKVYPVEVENILLQIDGVKDATVHGEANQMTGNIVVASVTVDKKHKNREFVLHIREYCKKHLEKYKNPVRITLKTEVFSSNRFKRVRKTKLQS